MNETRCERVQDDLALFTLGALDPDLDPIQSHLESCAACQRVYQEHLEAVAQLTRAAQVLDPISAPPELKAKVLATTAEVDPPTPTVVPKRVGGFARWFAAPLWVPALAAANVVLLLAAGWLLYERQVSVAHSDELRAAVEALLARGGNTQFLGATADASPGSWGRVYVHPDKDVAVVLVADTPPPPAGMTYHLWFQQGDDFVDAGEIQVWADGDKGEGWLITRRPPAYDNVLVTMEPQGVARRGPEGPVLLAASEA